MSVEGVDFGSVALTAAARDLTAPLVLLRQLSFQLDGQLAANESPATRQTLQNLRAAVGRTFNIADQLRLALADENNLVLEPVQLKGLCHELNSELKPLQRELKCNLDFELPRRQSVVAVGNYQALKTILNGSLESCVGIRIALLQFLLSSLLLCLLGLIVYLANSIRYGNYIGAYVGRTVSFSFFRNLS